MHGICECGFPLNTPRDIHTHSVLFWDKPRACTFACKSRYEQFSKGAEKVEEQSESGTAQQRQPANRASASDNNFNRDGRQRVDETTPGVVVVVVAPTTSPVYACACVCRNAEREIRI